MAVFFSTEKQHSDLIVSLLKLAMFRSPLPVMLHKLPLQLHYPQEKAGSAK